MTRHAWMAVAVTMAALAVTGPVRAQTVTGRVLDGGTREPIMLATVELLDTAGVVVDGTISDKAGAFRLQAPGPGSYLLRAGRLGYRETVDGILELGEGGRISVDFYLRVDPVELEEIRVATERARERYLESQGFYTRVQGGSGSFLTPEQIEQAGPAYDAPDLLRRIPFVQRLDDGAGGATIQVLGRGGPDGRRCVPRIFIDNQPVFAPLDALLEADDVLGVEVYRGASQVPLEYGGTHPPCGVVLIWTRWGQLGIRR